MTDTLGLIGCGAFGAFALRHLTPFFAVRVYDQYRDLAEVASIYNIKVTSLEAAAGSDVVVVAVPVQRLDELTRQIAPMLRLMTGEAPTRPEVLRTISM